MDGAALSPRLEDLVAAQAGRTPAATAILWRGRLLTYGELWDQVERLCAALVRHGVGPGILVAVRLSRTPTAIAALLAILRAGGAYLPIDPADPVERTAFVLLDSGAAVLLTDTPSPACDGFRGAVLELLEGRIAPSRCGGPPAAVVPEAAAYVIYTSGSTGRPKGVVLGHEATHLVAWAREAYSEEERARVAATTSLCFDPSIFEIFLPLATGGTMILKQTVLEPFAPDERPTLLDTVPSVLAELCRAGALPGSLRVLNVGGERLTADLARAVYQGRPELSLYNHYGPTEATTCVTVGRVARNLADEPSIGRPVRGAQILLLDPGGEPAAPGEAGEIHIGGPGLALGYLNRPELTAERFVETAHGRLYRTGDLGAWRDGELHFAGRLDEQVKIRGFRVELGEVEAALRRVEGVERAFAALRQRGGRGELVAYVQSATATEQELRSAAAAWLPAHMLPGRIVVSPSLPVLASGKLDIGALPDPEASHGEAAALSRMERPILLVFEEVLGRTGIRPEQSFFELGGDSLLSVRAAARLETVLGFELPAALLHQAPTARALALALQHGRPRAEGHISLLQPGGAGPPVFCMADLYGQAFNYLSLARRLGADRPVYGLVPGGLQAAFTRDGDIARLTQTFKAEVRRIQPRGPYLIAGYSAGGVLAVDLACALEQEGETVRLVLLDACLHSQRLTAPAVVRWTARQARALLARDGRTTARRRLGALLRQGAERLTPGAPDWIPPGQSSFAARMMKVGARYRPAVFSGAALMIVASERHPLDLLYDQDGLLGWSSALKGPVEQTPVAGGHHAIMREPSVAATALAVRRFLGDAH